MKNLTIQNRNALNLGVLMLDSDGSISNRILIPRNTLMPITVKRVIAPKDLPRSHGSTSLICDFHVTECSTPETDPRFVKTIWSGLFHLKLNHPVDSPTLQIFLSYDACNCASAKVINLLTNETAWSFPSPSIDAMLDIP